MNEDLKYQIKKFAESLLTVNQISCLVKIDPIELVSTYKDVLDEGWTKGQTKIKDIEKDEL